LSFHLGAHPSARDARAIFQRGVFRPVETWLDPHGRRFNPGNYYYVGGNSKFYGAVLIRYRERDFAALEHWDGVSPEWPFGYEVLEPWYGRAEQLFEVRGVVGQDPTEPPHSTSYTSTPVPDEPAIAAHRAACFTGAASVLTATRGRRRSLAPAGTDTLGCLS
jgi:choline dehydrogenase-like flavoprotein